jgi:hypothetical protein
MEAAAVMMMFSGSTRTSIGTTRAVGIGVG